MIRLVVLVAVCVAAVQGTCNGSCSTPLVHYNEIGCEAVFSKPDDCCPSHYNCDKFFGQAKDKCYFKGKEYAIHEIIPEDLTAINCAASCHCTRGEWHDLNCANIECPEGWHHQPIEPGCFRTYKVDGCCAGDTVCPPFDKLATCELEGKKYYEGQIMSVTDKERDLKCVCGPNFKGELVEPFCKQRDCGIEVRYTANIRKKCAPVFYGTELNCPIQWECPQEGDSVVPNAAGSKSDKKCHYGTQELNVGDKLVLKRSVHSPETNCECQVPPLVTCVQKPHVPPKPIVLTKIDP